MNFWERPIAITDVETTGLDEDMYEIIEIGTVLVHPRTLEIQDTLDVRVWPEHPEVATEKAMEVNGFYNRYDDWEHDAVTLQEAMEQYAEATRDAVFCAHNVTFDWAFIKAAFKKTGVKSHLDYHRLDLLTIAWDHLRGTDFEGGGRMSLDAIAEYLDLEPEPRPHRAINGAVAEYHVLSELLAS